MFDRLKEIYEQGFPEIKISTDTSDYVFNKVKSFGERSLRAFIKATIDAFDLIRYYPQEPPNKLLEE